MSRPLASPGMAARWMRALPRLFAACAGLLVLNLGCLLMIKGLYDWPSTLAKSLIFTVGAPLVGLAVLRWDPGRWLNAGLLTGLAAASPVVMAAAPHRHTPTGWILATVALGGLFAWLVGREFRRAGALWLDPLATDLAERPIRLVIRLEHGAGRVTVHPSGLHCAVEPVNELVVAAEADAKALLRWAQIASVGSGVLQVGDKASRALRVILASGGQLILPTGQAAALAAICAVRARVMTQPPATRWLGVRLAFAEIYAGNPRTNVRLPLMAAQALFVGVCLSRAAAGWVGGDLWLIMGGIALAALVQQCRQVRSMMLELTRMREEAAANAGRVPSVAAPPGWRPDPAQTSYQRPLYN